MFILLSV